MGTKSLPIKNGCVGSQEDVKLHVASLAGARIKHQAGVDLDISERNFCW